VSAGDDFDLALDAPIARDQTEGGLCFELTTTFEKNQRRFHP
jgi:hypothetical protein